jgi:hypothetical protein
VLKSERFQKKFRNTLQQATGKEFLAFRIGATQSRSIKSTYDFIIVASDRFFLVLYTHIEDVIGSK